MTREHTTTRNGEGLARPTIDSYARPVVNADVRYAKNGDRYVAYEVLGDGPVDVLAYSSGALLSLNRDDEPHWRRFDNDLAAFSRLIRFDPGGIGLSDPLLSGQDMSPETWVQDALAVMDDLGVQHVAHFGVAQSGIPVLLLAATYPERASALILFNAWARLLRDVDYPIGIPERLVRGFIDSVNIPGAADAGIDLQLMAPSLADDPEFMRWWRESSQRAASPSTAAARNRLISYSDVRSTLSAIAAPTLVLHRRDNQLFRIAHGRYLAEHIAGARLVELDGADVLPFVGRTDESLAEMQAFLTGQVRRPHVDRQLATLLVTDIVESTRSAVAAGDDAWVATLEQHDRMTGRQVARFGGRIVKHTGDGVLAIVDGPAQAVRCALAIRDGAHQQGLDVRVGIHTGEVERRGDDLAGIGVHIVARVAALAAAGEVWVTRTVTDLVAGSELAFEPRGVHVLKGVSDPWALFAVAR